MIISLVLHTENKYRIEWVWPVNTTFCQKLVKNKLWIQKGMYQRLPKWISRLWKASGSWHSKLPRSEPFALSATLPGSQTNHIVSSLCRASTSQSTSCSFYSTLNLLTYLSLGPPLWLVPLADPGNRFNLIYFHMSKGILHGPWKIKPTILASITFLQKRERARKSTGHCLGGALIEQEEW